MFYKWDISYKIIWCAMNVHKVMWPWFPEIIYQRALLLEFEKCWLNFSREKWVSITYDWKSVWWRRADFIVDGDVLVELKAVSQIDSLHKSQLLNYLKAYNCKLWLLINFWSKSLEYFRFIK